jgi:AcrR family transcriptional regulator
MYSVSNISMAYSTHVPKLWNQTIEAHRREVRDAILDTTAALASAHGLRSVTMSQIAEQTGIGRATLYKYFPDVDLILRTWHEREIDRHLAQLASVRDHSGTPRPATRRRSRGVRADCPPDPQAQRHRTGRFPTS